MSADATKITQAQLESHVDPKDFWCLISGKVYDCSSFMDEHPGGDEIIIAEADATEPFEDVGHSDEARQMLTKMYVGDFDGVFVKKPKVKTASASSSSSSSSTPIVIAVVALVAALYVAWRFTLAE